ncbi:unnamed protein product, partial [Ectocarpus sp. 4 AP-2014]
CPCGRAIHGFCSRGIGEDGYGQQRESTDCQKRAAGEKNELRSFFYAVRTCFRNNTVHSFASKRRQLFVM